MAERRAFTLVEVLVALTIGTLIVLGVRALIDGLSFEAERLEVMGREMDAVANGDRVLRESLGQLELDKDRDATFGGDRRTTRFSSWCRSSRGWRERCRVQLVIDTLAGGRVLFMNAPNADHMVLERAHSRMSLLYLADAAQGGTWIERWGNGLSAPIAVGIVVDDDTLIIRVGERG